MLPVAPGTWGTLAAIPIYLLLVKSSLPIYLLFTIAAFLLGIWVSDKVSKDLMVHDHSGIVWDEVVGYLITMIYVPLNWIWIVVGFLLFRVFDVWKPQPIRYIDEHLKGGLGIMMDDVLAAIPAWLILQCLVWIFK